MAPGHTATTVRRAVDRDVIGCRQLVGSEPRLAPTERSRTAYQQRLARSILAAIVTLFVLNTVDLVAIGIALHAPHAVRAHSVSRVLVTSYLVEAAKAVILLVLAWRATHGRPTLAWAMTLWCATGVYTITGVATGVALWAVR